MGSISLERVLLPYFFGVKISEWWRSQLFTVSHFGSANITTQTLVCQVGSPHRSPRFLNKSENRQNPPLFILRYYSAFCMNDTFKSIRIHSETQVLVAPPPKKPLTRESPRLFRYPFSLSFFVILFRYLWSGCRYGTEAFQPPPKAARAANMRHTRRWRAFWRGLECPVP